jgi:hypothetical protein
LLIPLEELYFTLVRYKKTRSIGGEEIHLRACLGISGTNGNEGYWGGGISIISQNFSKSPSILSHPIDSSISQTSLLGDLFLLGEI